MKQEPRPLISVIVPVYNNAAFLNRCVDSILSQSYGALEVLLIDDGSTDGSGDICDGYKRKDSRVKVVHQSNNGTVSARYCGLKFARGSMVSFIDGDDWVDTCMYEKLIEFYFRQGCPDMVSSGLIFEYPETDKHKILLDGAASGNYSKQDIVQKLLPVLIYDSAVGHRPVLTSVCTKLIDKKVAQKAMEYMKYSLSLGEDGAYVYFLICCCSSFAVLHRAFYHYEQHDASQNYKFNMESFYRLAELKEVMTRGMERLGWGENLQIREQVNYYVWEYLWRVIEEQFHMGMNRFIYLFPFARCEKGCTVLLYGAGAVGKSYARCLAGGRFVKKVIWADKNYRKLREAGLDVLSLEEALEEYFDYIVIAIEDETVAKSIMKNLIRKGIEKEKLVWEKPVRINPYG